MADDDEEARKLRAQQLRRETDALREGKSPERPPRSPYEFVEREMREHAEEEEGERGEDEAPPD